MGDLISREAVIDVLKQTGIIQDNDRGHCVVDEINRIPTAYDVEKVVAELEQQAEKYRKRGFVHEKKDLSVMADKNYAKQCGYLEAIDIVKRGGVE